MSTATNETVTINNTTTNHQPIPGEISVIRRNGTITLFDGSKIELALSKAFLAVEGNQAVQSNRVHEIVKTLTQTITETISQRWPTGGTAHIENIQDLVELTLMREGEQAVARAYVLYREDRRRAREKQLKKQPKTQLNLVYPNGETKPLDDDHLEHITNAACADLKDVDASLVRKETLRNLFDGASLADLHKSLVISTRTMIEKDPNYSFVAARLLLNELYQESLNYLEVKPVNTAKEMQSVYSGAFKQYIQKGIKVKLLNPELAEFNLEKLGNAINALHDNQFTYLSLQTLYDRYFLHDNNIRIELPQCFFMRVAMGLALAEEKNREDRAIEFYQLLASFDYMTSTPTLFNAGTNRPQLSSCFLTTIPDDLDGIYSSVRDNALLSKFAGGIGNDWTPVRAMGAHIHGTNGKSLGVVPFMNVADATAVAVNQGGKRKGAVCGYLETWHLDIEEFLELRKNTGDDRRRTHDMNTANWVPDLFMKRVFENQEWTLFSPNEATELHDLYGDDFEKAYINYEQQAEKGKIRCKKISAVSLWRKMLSMLFETGHPWVTFKDPCNLRSPQQHTGVVHSSNLCTEITLNTSKDEVAVCNLGSINLAQHVTAKGLDTNKLAKTIQTAVRMLDNVIDINYYTIPQARKSNLRHRPVGLGLMGFQDALYKMRIPYSSEEAISFADTTMETISYHAISASVDLAEERGSYASYEGSLWSQGILPIDSIAQVKKSRGKYLEQDTSHTLAWKKLRTRVTTSGIRNSNIMAIAPTATISNICGVSQSIEPTYQNLFVKSNMSGEFTVVNPYLINDLKAQNLWDEVMVNDLKYYDGSVQSIERIPTELKTLYKTAFEVEPRWLVDCASRRQKWIDQAQSLNLYMAEPSGKKLDILYRMAWLRGLKTTYYLRSLGATSAEKSTITDNKLNAVTPVEPPKVCSILDPDCEACQ